MLICDTRGCFFYDIDEDNHCTNKMHTSKTIYRKNGKWYCRLGVDKKKLEKLESLNKSE